MTENRFEALADIDVDGAVFEIGLQHYAIGPARPAILFNTGAVEIRVNVHHSDITTMIDALRQAKRLLKAAKVRVR